MTVGELLMALEGDMADYRVSDDPVVAIAKDGTTYTIKAVREEAHELGATVWLEVEEN